MKIMNEEMNAVMLDWETMGTGPGAAVVQLGAAAFNSVTGATDPEHDFLVDIDLTSALMLGGYTDRATVDWWRARGGFKRTDGPLREIRSALAAFSAWFLMYPKVERVWANGSQFDIAIAEGNYRAARIPCPWPYNAGRDMRTVADLAKEKGWVKPETEPAHEAREDARAQIKTLMSALAAVRGM